MSSSPSDFLCGDMVTIIATNKPITDLTVAPSLNDYKWADSAIISIYDPRNALIVQAPMCPSNKTGWYSYKYISTCECGIGVYRVEVTMSTTVVSLCTPSPTGTVGTTGTSGDSGTEVCSALQTSYFRIMSKERF